ncbi:hypothetical protein Indivirus_1_42 [Indivirus ILV1]|uniref:Uncharacterized protein n=1 Tax=Indivirus ILV1 TaxID=1977633 RepID=A0A1V0SCI3_9VIRU|nr:hypothetical protein Indivirus_1_42 [Indivirus ILV1]
MNQETMQLITDFNSTLLTLAKNVASICPTSIIGSNIKDIEKQIKRKENFTKFIDLFCIKVLQYKDQIDSGEESFFMNKDYSKDIEGHDIGLSDIISLQSVWKEFKKENKDIVILNMQILCDLAQMYFEIATSN